MSASTNFSFGPASMPADPSAIHGSQLVHAAVKPGAADTAGATSDTATASALAGAAFDAVPGASRQAEQHTPLVRYRRDGGAQPAATGIASRCYFPVTPVNTVTPDANGKIRGADLKGTRTYERLVQALSSDPRHPSRTPSAARIAGARAAVDGMKLPLGSTVIAPCQAGDDTADRSGGKQVSSTGSTPAGRTRRAVQESAATHVNDGAAPDTSAGSKPSIDPGPQQTGTVSLDSADPCRPIGLWQRVFDAIARFVGAYSHPSAINDAPSTSDGKRADACPENKEAIDQELRNYDNYLMAWAISFTRRRRANA